ncbi:MAG: hypothetical protein P8047_15995 [Gammaproteobacteria bacterium]
MKKLTLIIILLCSGCTGVGFVATSDPGKKLQQAYALIAQDRAVMAEDVIKQAMNIYKEKNDKLGMAEAYHAFGNLYMSKSYHGKNAETFKSLGTYDGTYQNSINNFKKAIGLFEASNSEVGVVKSMVGIGNAYIEKSEPSEACKYYNQALSRYNADKKSGAISNEPQIFDKRFSNMGQVIEAYVEHYKCRT